jgi:uncharacterized protein YutE (UPF0331/DUF86 family)
VSPGKIDVVAVQRHLMALRRAVAQLSHHAGRPVELLRSDVEEAWLVERGMQLAAQNAIDIATHIAASAGLDAADYATAIDRLAELRVLDGAFAAKFRSVAGFRNILVHGYLDVDVVLLHAALNERLTDFTTFADCVEKYLAV